MPTASAWSEEAETSDSGLKSQDQNYIHLVDSWIKFGQSPILQISNFVNFFDSRNNNNTIEAQRRPRLSRKLGKDSIAAFEWVGETLDSKSFEVVSVIFPSCFVQIWDIKAPKLQHSAGF